MTEKAVSKQRGRKKNKESETVSNKRGRNPSNSEHDDQSCEKKAAKKKRTKSPGK